MMRPRYKILLFTRLVSPFITLGVNCENLSSKTKKSPKFNQNDKNVWEIPGGSHSILPGLWTTYSDKLDGEKPSKHILQAL